MATIGPKTVMFSALYDAGISGANMREREERKLQGCSTAALYL
jgi:hypothetical protein